MAARIVAAVAHWDEPPAFLERLGMSLVGVVDEVVELGGRWALVPAEGEPEWPSQVAKRDALMRFAGEEGDWILVIDGDEYVQDCDAPALREALCSTDRDVASVTLHVLNRMWPYRHLASIVTVTRRIYRAGTRVVGPAHNDYGRRGIALNGPGRLLAPSLDLSGLLTIAHDNRARPRERDQAMQDYRRRRRGERVEMPA